MSEIFSVIRQNRAVVIKFYARVTLSCLIAIVKWCSLQKNRIRDAAYRYQYALKKLPVTGRENTSDCVSLDVYAELQVNLMLNLSRCKRKLNVRPHIVYLHCYFGSEIKT